MAGRLGVTLPREKAKVRQMNFNLRVVGILIQLCLYGRKEKKGQSFSMNNHY